MKQYFFLLGVLLSTNIVSQAQINDAPQSGPNYVVNTLGDTDDSVCGTSNCTLREAISAANSRAGSDVIQFADSVKGTIQLSNALPSLSSDINLQGPGARTLTVRGSGSSGNYRLFTITSGVTITISGLSLKDGFVSDNGGAIANSGTLIINSCTLSGNRAGNSANSRGGGIFNDGTLNISNSTIANNSAGVDESSGSGGGIFTTGSTTISNCTISGNSAASFGGGIFSTKMLTLNSSTVSGNNAYRSYLDDGIYASGTLIIGNTILNQNGDTNGNLFSGDTLISQGFNISSDKTGPSTGTNDRLSTDPRLEPLANNGGPTDTHALASDSPAIDAGNTPLNEDQRGIARPQGRADDIGAFETLVTPPLPVSPLVVTLTSDENDGDFSAGDLSLREAILSANADSRHNAITFDATVFAAPRKTITLNGTQLPGVTNNGNLFITAPVAGIEINGNNQSRLLSAGSGANLILTGLTMRGGKANSGGGLFVSGATVLLERCAFIGNSANLGGAIYSNTDLSGTTLTLRNCTLSGNSATSRGGGLYNEDGLTVLDSCTIANNTAPANAGGGIASAANNTTRTQARNSIIADNIGTNADFVPGSGINSFESKDYNYVGKGNALGAFNQINDVANPYDYLVSPLGLLPLADNGGPTSTHALELGSLAMNSGNTTLREDQRGVVRPQGWADDKGAFEFTPGSIASIVVTLTNDENDGDLSAGDISLNEAIRLASFNPDQNVITFDETVFAAPRKTIVSSTPYFYLTGKVSITGPSSGVIIKGAHFFTSGSDSEVLLNKLTLTGPNYDYGSAISNANGCTLVIANCTLSDNHASEGGAIRNSSNLTIINSTLSGNTASNYGGAIYNTGPGYFPARLIVLNSTFSGNTARIGGAICGGIYSTDGSSVSIGNTILQAGAQGYNLYGAATSLGYNIFSDFTGPYNGTNDQHETNPLLGPLQDNGGPTPTHALLPGSPALDAGNATGSDQRGRARPADVIGVPNVGNGSDIGAVEQGSNRVVQSGPNYVVNQTADRDDGFCTATDCTLREAINAANGDGVNNTITFDAVIFGSARKTITLNGTPLPALFSNEFFFFFNSYRPSDTLDIVAPPAGVVIDGNGQSRVLEINLNAFALLNGLTIRGGNADQGGGILNRGTLTLTNSTLNGNQALRGGAIFNAGGSSSPGGTLTMTNCTLSGNTATESGGGIYISPNGALTMRNSTLSSNSAPEGGGVLISAESWMNIGNTILNNNAGGNIQKLGGVRSAGYNLSSDAAGGDNTTMPGGFLNAPGDMRNTNPLLGPLADNGGQTPTHALLQGSPAINKGNANLATDQRGVPRPQGADSDIGAYEAVLLSISDVTIEEGDSGSKNAIFPVTLSTTLTTPVSVHYSTLNSSAKSGEDFSPALSDSDGATPGILMIPAGQTTGSISVPIIGDTISEDSELFYVLLSSPSNAVFSKARGTGTINDNDPPPLSINNVSIEEGNAGERNANFTIRLNRPSRQVVSVVVASANGSGLSGSDYQALPPTMISFAPGEIQRFVTVAVLGDTLDEDNENFMVNLSNAQNATIADGQGVALILDDDQSPLLSIGDASVVEGNSGARNLIFTLSLSKPSGKNVSVRFATADGIARASSDYKSLNGTLSFVPGQTSKTFNVAINGDTQVEGNETLYVLLSNAINSTITRGRGTGTIVNDDASD